MIKTTIIIIFCLLSTITKAQTSDVEKSTYGIQVGLIGAWVHNESKLSNTIALRTELGFDSGIWGGSFYEKTGFLMTPKITLEPRWYYNLAKRASKGKKTYGNGGNFVSLNATYHPDWFVISNYDNISVISDISFIPTWGIRRNFSKHFNYEVGAGLGVHHIFAKQAGYSKNETEIIPNIHVRIGYRFK